MNTSQITIMQERTGTREVVEGSISRSKDDKHSTWDDFTRSEITHWTAYEQAQEACAPKQTPSQQTTP